MLSEWVAECSGIRTMGGVGEQLAIVDGMVEDQLQHGNRAAGQVFGPARQQHPVAELVDMTAGQVRQQFVAKADLGILEV